jgi:hypothetical protein
VVWDKIGATGVRTIVLTTTHGGEREKHALGFKLAVGECLLDKRFEGLLHVDGILGTPCKKEE